MNKYIVFDRDGTLIKHEPYLYLTSRIKILPNVIDVIKQFKEKQERGEESESLESDGGAHQTQRNDGGFRRGPELIAAVRSHDHLAGIPVVLLTAKSDEESKISGKDVGADAFLGKPFNAQELGTTVRNLLQLKENEESPKEDNAQSFRTTLHLCARAVWHTEDGRDDHVRRFAGL